MHFRIAILKRQTQASGVHSSTWGLPCSDGAVPPATEGAGKVLDDSEQCCWAHPEPVNKVQKWDAIPECGFRSGAATAWGGEGRARGRDVV